jgi:hypothetical protein
MPWGKMHGWLSGYQVPLQIGEKLKQRFSTLVAVLGARDYSSVCWNKLKAMPDGSGSGRIHGSGQTLSGRKQKNGLVYFRNADSDL